ncbi:hypothetical protein [Burkholderia glumae]|uniref:hypothetical protein n=1 Tax=Burkholderia glumae TaxID=337 RepID=UPI00214FEA92|nr:hypothetical protein [Burkholderia glumae]
MTTTNESSKHIDPAVDAVTTLRAIAEFPVADQFNQDAINMKLTAQNFFHREVARKNLGEIPEGLSKPADGGPAFPSGLTAKEVKFANGRVEGAYVSEFASSATGLSLRDYFAAKAMQGLLCANSVYATSSYGDDLSARAYQIADSMLKARG